MIRRLSGAMRKWGSDQWALTGVLALWTIMTAIALTCVVVYGRNLPWREDWDMVPALTGQQPNLPEWFWAQNNEHRLPLQKVLYLVLLKISGGDFRIGMFANTVMVATLCLAMILTARLLRGGQTRLADAFFPLVLLHLGHWENMVWGWQIQFVISTILVGMWLLIIVQERWPLSPKAAVTAGLILILLPLSGANGIIFSLFVAFWLAAGTLLYRREMTARWLAPLLSACVGVSIALTGLYFVGYVHPPWAPPNPGLGPTIVTGVRFVGMAFGPVGAGKIYPKWITGGLTCAVAFLLLASSIIPLRRGLCDNRTTSERSRAFGLLVFAAATVTFVLVMAWGRAGWVPDFGMPDRYALLSVPALCAAYFVWILYGRETIRDDIATVFAIAALAALPFNLLEGYRYGEGYVIGMQAFERDLSNGLSWPELADRHYQFLFRWDHDGLIERMRMLHNARIGPLGAL